jgi:hypothetical protein
MTNRGRARLKQSLPNVLVLFIAVVWFWFSKFYRLSGSNPGEAFGRDLVSVGLPGLVFWFAVRGLYRQLKKQGAIAPYKLTFGSICGSCALIAIFDLFSPSDPHKVGAVFVFVVFGIIASILFGLSYRQERRHRKTLEASVEPAPRGI